MKKYIKLLLTLSLGMNVCSCLDFNPEDQLADGNMWQAASDFEYFANDFYSWTRDFSTVLYDAPHSDLRADLVLSTNTNSFSHGNNTIPGSDKNYTDNYNHIRRTNMLLEKAEKYSGSGDISRYVAEAKFFRAYSYFDLVQLFGNVILTKKPLDVTSPEMNAVRNDRGEVIDFIIQDLKEAAPSLPATVSTDEEGRLTKWAAYAFLSRVALYEGTWQKFHNGNTVRSSELLTIAAEAAKEVIDKGGYGLFYSDKLKEYSYKYLFILENVQSNPANLTKNANNEYIFYRRHDETLLPIGKNVTTAVLASQSLTISRKFANLFLTQAGVPMDVNNEQLYQTPTSEFDNRDNRMKNIFLPNGVKYWNNTEKSSRNSWTAADESRALTCDVRKGTGYMNQKWATERYVNDTKEGYDYPIIRYAEVLLNYAEAVYEKCANDGNTEDAKIDAALVYLNKVRKRVNPDMPDLTIEFAKAHSLNLQEEIRRERTIELFHEGFRLDDLKRWKTAEDEMPQDVKGIRWIGTFQTLWGDASSKRKDNEGCLILEDGRSWQNKNYLYPLPTDQTQLNPNLGQNPEW